jgi:hypothetical protein
MVVDGGSNPMVPAQGAGPPEPKKRWWVIAAGAVAAAFLAAFGTWLFTRVAPLLEGSSALEVSVNDTEGECDAYALPASLLEDVPVASVEGGRAVQLAEFDGKWIVEHGGLPVTARMIELTLHGKGEEAVVIHSLDVADFEPITVDEEIIVIYECKPFGGEMGVSTLATNFADMPPVLELTDPELHFPYQVAKDDPEVFVVSVTKQGNGDAQVCFCRWNIGITWSAGKDRQQLVVEGDSIGVATAVLSNEWQDYWFVDGEWSTQIPSTSG